MSAAEYVVNPLTGRVVRKDGHTYKRWRREHPMAPEPPTVHRNRTLVSENAAHTSASLPVPPARTPPMPLLARSASVHAPLGLPDTINSPVSQGYEPPQLRRNRHFSAAPPRLEYFCENCNAPRGMRVPGVLDQGERFTSDVFDNARIQPATVQGLPRPRPRAERAHAAHVDRMRGALLCADASNARSYPLPSSTIDLRSSASYGPNRFAPPHRDQFPYERLSESTEGAQHEDDVSDADDDDDDDDHVVQRLLDEHGPELMQAFWDPNADFFQLMDDLQGKLRIDP